MPDPTVEEDRPAPRYTDVDSAIRQILSVRFPDPVVSVAAWDGAEVATADLRDIRQEVGALDRHARSGFAFQFAIQATAVLMPAVPLSWVVWALKKNPDFMLIFFGFSQGQIF